MASTALAFQETKFDIIDREGHVWLKAADIARALGYAREDSISAIYRRNADEFTDSMTQNVNLTFAEINDLPSSIRIFSLRGAHLLAMFARTAIAKQFRKWVLDVLERETDATVNALPKNKPDARRPVMDAANLLATKRGVLVGHSYLMVHQRFNVAHIDELSEDQIPLAIEYLHTLAVQGEYLPREAKPEPIKGYNFSDDEAIAFLAGIKHCQTMWKFWPIISPVLRQLGADNLCRDFHDGFTHSKVALLSLKSLAAHCADVSTKQISAGQVPHIRGV